MTDIAMWWHRDSTRARNFGDELGPAIIERLGHTPRRVPIHQADLVACGSVLETLSHQASDGTIVWGTGLMGLDTWNPNGPHLDIRAVRGRLTAKHIGDRTAPLGDPAILVPHLWGRPPVRHRIGVVRHYIDRRAYPWADLIIDPCDPVDTVIDHIGSCAAIASSSLHGLIVAQAWGIPTMRLHHPDVMGGNWKWADHLTALDRPIANIQRHLLNALPEVTR